MEDPKLVAASTIALAVTLFAIFSIRPVARRLGLVDKPDGRKHHRGQIPLIGGLCFFLGMLVGLSYLGYLDRFVTSLIAGGVLLVMIGVVDDFAGGLSVRSRLLAEAGIVALVIVASGYYVDDLGLSLPGNALRLGMLGVPLTIIAVIGLINAFNMLDGIDGLAASMAMVSIAAILFFDHVTWSVPSVVLLLQVLFAALVPYLFVNLGWPDGRKVFMGDAGSTLIGFLLAWSVIFLSHRSVARLAPVDVLWCVAIPVMDTLGVMYRRIRAGRSPFKPDRLHLHHLMLDAGFPPRMALVGIILAAGALAMLGYLLRDVSPWVSLFAFAAVVVMYVLKAQQLLALFGFPFRPRSSERAASVGNDDAGTMRGLASQARVADSDVMTADSAEQRAPLKALCMLAAASDTATIAPIAQQLSQDARFEPTMCVAAAAGHDAEDALHVFDLEQGRPLHAADIGRDPADIGSAVFGDMTRVLNEVQPDMVLVPGDTAASFATTLVAYYHQIPVVRIDTETSQADAAADLPDEASRKVINALASLHVAANESAGRHLIAEGVPIERVLVADDGGNDACERIVEALAGLLDAPDQSSHPVRYAGPPPVPAMQAVRGGP